MVASPALEPGADGKVLVRLSEVPPELRLAVADRLERAWTRAGIKGFDLLRLRLAAERAFPDVTLEVPAWKAHRVLVEHKLPRGSTPTFSERSSR